MPRALLVAVRFHEGRYHGAGGWPPAPARLFQALMAGVAKGVRVPDATRDALDWLERLPPPTIAAPCGEPGQGYTSFVPNNDLDAALTGKSAPSIEDAVATIRVGKTVRPILFDAAEPVLYSWSFDGDDERAMALCEAAVSLYQLGRGLDMAWADAAVVDADEAQKRISNHGGIVHRPTGGVGADRSLLCPQPGTVRSLEDRFAGMGKRFRSSGSNRKPVQVFVQPSKPLLASVGYDARIARLVFALRGGDARGGFAERRLNEAAGLVAEVRDKAAERLRETVPALSADVERFLIGRGAVDADKAARVRIVPLPSIGHLQADMAIRRVAVYVPQSCPLRRDDLAWAFAEVDWINETDGVVLAELQRADEDSMAARYEKAGRLWDSVTPLALVAAARRRIDPTRTGEEAKDAAERAREEVRAAHAVRQALRHAGVHVSPAEVRVQREPFDGRGTRAEAFAAGTRFPKHAFWHVALTFSEPVTGPLLLGDGRYLGLGLMRPVALIEGALAFAIKAGLAEDADPALVARAARRAMLARVQAALPHGQRVPSYASGHEDDGSPARYGSHRHIAVVPDLPRRRILFFAPNLLQRGGVDWREIAGDHAQLERALEGMSVLRAGQAGRLYLSLSVLDAGNDPLFSPSRVWDSISDYRVTRHRHRLSNEEALKADALGELDRIGWPVPAAIDVLSTHRGPRGGLSGRLRLTFATAQKGPLAIGRTLHKGGGLFASST